MRSSNIYFLWIAVSIFLILNTSCSVQNLTPFEKKWINSWNVSDTLFFRNIAGNEVDTLVFLKKTISDPTSFKVLGKSFTISDISEEFASCSFKLKHKDTLLLGNLNTRHYSFKGGGYPEMKIFNKEIQVFDNMKEFNSQTHIENNYNGSELIFNNQLSSIFNNEKIDYIILSQDSIIKEYSIDNEVYQRVF